MLAFLKAALIFELSAVLWLSALMSRFFYRAYVTSSEEHLPVSFLAALVVLVLGTQQTAMLFRGEKLKVASGYFPAAPERRRLKAACSTLIVLLFLATGVLLSILRYHLR